VARKVAAVVRLGINNITFLPHPPPRKGVRETMQEFILTVKPMVEEMVPDLTV
jgi:hypothetical protein